MITRMFALFALACLPAFANAEKMKPGQWEIETSMKMQGMQLPGAKFTHCYTAKDIAAGKQYNTDEEGKCAISNMKASGGHVSYDMACTIEGGKMTGSIKGTMSATAYSFDQKMRMTPDHGMGEMHSIIKGRRLGDCK